ncbi:MAG: transposase, partial [Terrimicrobiaceae bacterium]
MKQKRRNHSAEFKARIALEALKGLKAVQQIAAENNLHPVQVTQWKGQVLESAAGVFERGRDRAAQAQDEEKDVTRRNKSGESGESDFEIIAGRWRLGSSPRSHDLSRVDLPVPGEPVSAMTPRRAAVVSRRGRSSWWLLAGNVSFSSG